MECIIGSILLNNEAKINAYNDISHVIDKIKENKAIAKYVRAYGHFAVEREKTSKKFNFIFICQKCFKCYNLFRFYINSFFIFFEVFSLSTAKLPYVYPIIMSSHASSTFAIHHFFLKMTVMVLVILTHLNS